MGWSQRCSCAALACLLAVFAVACGDDDDDDGPSPADAGADAAADAGRDAGTDAGLSITCACDDTEDCAGCFANIGRCCYADETIEGNAGAMAERCGRSPTCHVCCSECAAMTCEELTASNSCPPPVP